MGTTPNKSDRIRAYEITCKFFEMMSRIKKEGNVSEDFVNHLTEQFEEVRKEAKGEEAAK